MLIILGIAITLFLFFTVFFGAPYVPAKKGDIRIAFDVLRPLVKKDVVFDLGSGDGRVLREASRRGARAIGYELHPLLVVVSRLLSWNDKNVEVRLKNFWRADIPEGTTVVYIFGDGRDIVKMTKKIETTVAQRKHLLDVISYGFELPGHTPINSAGAHHLYRIEPLQNKKA